LNKKDNITFWIGITVIFFVYLYTRYPVLNVEDSFRYYNSDFSIFSMMAEDIVEGRSFPFYYYGANYLGPFNSLVIIGANFILKSFGFVQMIPVGEHQEYIIGPYATTMACFFTVYLGIILWGLAFKRIFTVWETLLSCLLLSIGSALLVRTSLRPLGPEVAFLLSGFLILRGLILIKSDTVKNQLVFGLALGVSWWMNQTVVFVIAPLLFYWVAKSPIFALLRNNMQIKERLLLQMQPLNLPPLNKYLRYFLLFVYSLASINFCMGIVISAMGGVNTVIGTIKLKIHNGFSPIKTSVLIFLVTQFLLWLFKGDRSLQKLKKQLVPISYVILGFLFGYGPVLLGRVFKLYEKNYTPKFQFVPLTKIFTYWGDLYDSFVPGLLSNQLGIHRYLSSTLSYLFYCSLVTIIILFIKKNWSSFIRYTTFKPGRYSTKSIIWGIVFFNIIYIALSERSRDQFAYRYAILCLPVLAIFIAHSFGWVKRNVTNKYLKIFPFVILISFSIVTYLQGRQQIKVVKNSEHHVEKMDRLLNADCDIYFSNYWKTYLYEWLLQGQKKFAVIKGHDRTPAKTRRLLASNKRKCLIHDNWTITPYK
jgi:hypothetical protein